VTARRNGIRPGDEALLRRIAALGPEGGKLSRIATGSMYFLACSLIRRGLAECAPGGRVRITGEGIDALGTATQTREGQP